MTTIIKRSRKLLCEEEVFTQNAWDDTEWTEQMLQEAQVRIEEQKKESENYGNDINELEYNVTNKWNQFYSMHEDRFFKDRKWIFSEFHELLELISNEKSQATCEIFEVGCGVGNAVVHILTNNKVPNLRLHCCDLSDSAIEILRKRQFYLTHQEKIDTFQADICKDFDTKVRPHIEQGSLDIIMLIFTLSALKPEEMRSAIKNLTTLLKPNGMILFRDYARFDLTQLRFKGNALLRENYYIRSDGTTSYFFTKDYVEEIFTNAGQLIQVELKQDNRLLVNRSKGIKMCRCWIQGKFRKPSDHT